jgi:hypothetical protein
MQAREHASLDLPIGRDILVKFQRLQMPPALRSEREAGSQSGQMAFLIKFLKHVVYFW